MSHSYWLPGDVLSEDEDDWHCDLDDDDADWDGDDATLLVVVDWHNDSDDWDDEAEPIAPTRESC